MQKSIGTILLYTLVVSLVIFCASRDVDLVQLALPANSQGLGYAALAGLDGGLLIWAYVFRHDAHGHWQRGIAGIMVMVCLIGVIVSFGADMLIEAGRNGVTGRVPADVVTLIIVFVVAVLGANIAGATFHHMLHPDALKSNAEEEARAKIDAAATKQIFDNADGLAAQLAPIKGRAWVAQMAAKELASVDQAHLVGSGFEQYANTQELPSPKK